LTKLDCPGWVVPSANRPNREDGKQEIASIEVKVDEPILGYTTIEFTSHVLDRMEQRGVTQEDVLRTLKANKQAPGRQPPGRIRLYWHKSRNLTIHVVCEKGPNNLGIITVVPKQRTG